MYPYKLTINKYEKIYLSTLPQLFPEICSCNLHYQLPLLESILIGVSGGYTEILLSLVILITVLLT